MGCSKPPLFGVFAKSGDNPFASQRCKAGLIYFDLIQSLACARTWFGMTIHHPELNGSVTHSPHCGALTGILVAANPAFQLGTCSMVERVIKGERGSTKEKAAP